MSSTDVVRKPRARQALGDMGRSLGLMAVIIAVLLFIGPARTLIFPGDNRVQPVDYTNTVTGFDRVAHATALVPGELPGGWRANASRIVQEHHADRRLHIGWATPGSHYAGLDEGTGDPAGVLRAVAGVKAGTPSTVEQIGGRAWRLQTSPRGEQVLSRPAGRLTVVVTGDATPEQLRLLAAALH